MAPLLANLLNKATLTLTLEQEMLFVQPPLSPDIPTEDPFLRGTVLLSLPKPRLCKRLRVVAEGLADAFGGTGFPYESTKTLSREICLDLAENGPLSAGDHLMRFEILLPSSTAVFQRCSHGRVRHCVRAVVEFTKSMSKLSTESTAFWITATRSDPGDPPDPLDACVQHFDDHLGPIIVRVSSPHLTVSSLVYSQVEFLSPPLQSCTIVAISIFISQAFEVRYESGQLAQPHARRHLLLKVDPTLAHATPLIPTASRQTTSSLSSFIPTDPIRTDPNPLHELKLETPFSYEMVCRVPRDEIIRPSTLKGTITPIRVSHRLIMEVRYRVEGETEDRVLSIGRNCIIASCCCLSDSALPPYTRSPNDALNPVIQPLRNRCLCQVSLDQLFDSDGLPLQRVGTLPVRRTELIEEDEDEEEGGGTGNVRPEIRGRRIRDAKTAPAHLSSMEGRL